MEEGYHGGSREEKWGPMGGSSDGKGLGGVRVGGIVGVGAEVVWERRAGGGRCGSGGGSAVEGGACVIVAAEKRNGGRWAVLAATMGVKA